MTKNELWQIITDKNPQFLTGPSTFLPGGVRKLFDLAYDQGYRQGRDEIPERPEGMDKRDLDAFRDLLGIFR